MHRHGRIGVRVTGSAPVAGAAAATGAEVPALVRDFPHVVCARARRKVAAATEPPRQLPRLLPVGQVVPCTCPCGFDDAVTGMHAYAHTSMHAYSATIRAAVREGTGS